jgi:hypothetical protein
MHGKTLEVKAEPQIQRNGAQSISCAAMNSGKQVELTFANLSRYTLHTMRRSSSTSSNTSRVKSEQHQQGDGAQIISCAAVNDGKQLEVIFSDLSCYRLHTEWIKDASPSNTGPDFYRKSAADVWTLENFSVTEVEVSSDGQTLSLQYKADDGSSCKEDIKAKFLHASAPFVGKPLHTESDPFQVDGTGSLLKSFNIKRETWMRDLAMPTFDAIEVANDLNAQVELLETMIHTGVAIIKNVGPPESLERERVGLRMEALVIKSLEG